MAIEQPALGPGKGFGPHTGRAVTLRESAVLTSAWIAITPISVADARRCALRISYAADASGTSNRMQLRVMTCAEMDGDGSSPEVADDVWYPPTLIEATPTATILTGTVETGATITVADPAAGVVISYPGVWTIGSAAVAGTAVIRQKLVFDVSDDLWLYVAAKELGDTDAGDLGICAIKANFSL